jgi:hypothetical protein
MEDDRKQSLSSRSGKVGHRVETGTRGGLLPRSSFSGFVIIFETRFKGRLKEKRGGKVCKTILKPDLFKVRKYLVLLVPIKIRR